MLVIWVGLRLFYYQRKAFTVQEQLSEMQQNLRAATVIMAREIRLAGYIYGSTTTNAITVSDTDTITFLYSTGTDTVLDRTVTFGLDAADLQITRKQDSGSSQPLAENIEALSFAYGNNAAGATNTVEFSITARTDRSDPHYGGDGYRRGSLTTKIRLRNQ